MPHSVGTRRNSAVRGEFVSSPKGEEDFPQFTMYAVERALSGKRLSGKSRPPIVCLSQDGHNYYCVCTKTARAISRA